MTRRWVWVGVLWVLLVGKGWGGDVAPGQFSFRWEDEQGWLQANDAPVPAILKQVSEVTGIPILPVPGDQSRATVTLSACPLEKLINSLCEGSAITYRQDPATGECLIDRVRVASSASAEEQNRQFRLQVMEPTPAGTPSLPKPPPRYSGIGARVTLDEEQQGLWLTPLGRNAPAARAGIEAGDLAIAIDDRPIREFATINDMVAAIQGPVHTQVRLKVRKPDGSEVDRYIIREVMDLASLNP